MGRTLILESGKIESGVRKLVDHELYTVNKSYELFTVNCPRRSRIGRYCRSISLLFCQLATCGTVFALFNLLSLVEACREGETEKEEGDRDR